VYSNTFSIISEKQAKREGIDDQDYHDEHYSGRGGGLRDT